MGESHVYCRKKTETISLLKRGLYEDSQVSKDSDRSSCSDGAVQPISLL